MAIPEKYRAHIALITANVLFGLNYSYSKSIMPDFLTPYSLAVLRIMVAAVLFIITSVLMGRQKVERSDIPKIVVAAFLGILCNQYLFLYGLSFTSPVDASIITTGIPVLVLLISAYFLKERISPVKLTGVIVGAAGALLVILYGGIKNFGQGQLSGNMLVFISSVCYAGYLVWTKPLLEKYNPITMMAWMFSAATLLTGPIFAPGMLMSDFSAIPGRIWFAIFFVLLFATYAGYVCVAYGLRRVKPTTVSIYQYSQPVVASFFATIRGQDSVTWVKVVAAALVFGGVFLVTQAARFEKKL